MTTILFAERHPVALRRAVWLCAVLALAVVAQAAQPVVETSTREAVTFSLDFEDPVFAPVGGADDTWSVRIDGCVHTASPGQPVLPRRGLSLVVPPGTRPQLEVVDEVWRELDGRSLARQLLPVLVQDPRTGDVFERPQAIRPGDPLPDKGVPGTVRDDFLAPDTAPLSGPAVRLDTAHRWRGRRVVNLVVFPVRADAEGNAQRALSSGRWRVRFVDDAAAGKSMPAEALQRLRGKGDEQFAGHFLNGHLLQSLPTEAAHHGTALAGKARQAAKGTPLGYPEVRLPAQRTQLHRVRYSQLVTNGLLPGGATVNESEIRLYQRHYSDQVDDPTSDEARPYLEVEVPIHMVGEGDTFDGDDLFLFWGLRPADDLAHDVEVDGVTYQVEGAGDPQELNNEGNIYWLQFSTPDAGESWARMDQIALPASAGSPESAYRRTERYDEAVAYRENVPSIYSDRYYYNSVSAREVEVPLNVQSPVPGQTGAVLRAAMANLSTNVRSVLMELMDGEDIHTLLPQFDMLGNPYEQIYEESVPADVLLVDDLALRVRRVNTTQSLFSFLDWVEIEYDAQYAAPFGRLAFPGGDPGVTTGNLEIAGFPLGEDVGLVEVTDPRNPRFVSLTAANLPQDGDSITLSLSVSQPTEQRRFYAATRMFSTGVPDVDYGAADVVEDDTPPTRLTTDGVDVLVVAPEEFSEAVDAWVEYRQQRDPDLTIHVVEPQAVFDWYSGGLKNPWAIKRLVNHALESPTWGTWALVLMGDANENPRELGVPSEGRVWSRDWVPTHFHIQDASGLAPEVLASDEWYGNPYAHDGNFPSSNEINDMASLYVGRIPCASGDELTRVLAKIQIVEAGGDHAWRRRGIFMSDDSWSSGSLDAGGATLTHHPSERAFERSENRYLAQLWLNNAGQVALEPDTIMLRTYTDVIHPDTTEISYQSDVLDFMENVSSAIPDLINTLSAGASIVHYQGHANHYLMCHEHWFVDDGRSPTARRDVDLLTNNGKPWVFFGMGCHLGDFLQNVIHPSGNVGPGIGEKFLIGTDAGSVASYASSGYEYLQQNKQLSEAFGRAMFEAPPTVAVDGGEVRTRWLLGEMIWKAEREIITTGATTTKRAMVYQYVLLGDPLLMLDAGPPEVDATLAGSGPLEAETELVALDATGTRVVTMQARDEAGIDRLVVRDSEGNDLTAQVVAATPYYDDGRSHIMDYVITLPVRPFPHDVVIDVFDTADRLETDDHPSYTLSVAHESEATFTADGETVDPLTYVFQPGEPVDFTVSVTSAAWLDQDTPVTVEGDNLEVTGTSITVQDSDHLTVSFTATAPAAKASRGVRVIIDGFATAIELESSDVEPADGAVAGLVNYPNPMRNDTRFVFGTNVLSGTGQVRVWTVAGHSVAEVPFALGGDGREVVSWNGLDREGDELANGTYLYRVELSGPLGQVRSDMQRLVIMR